MTKTFFNLLKSVVAAGLTLSLISSSAFAADNSITYAADEPEQVSLLRYNCATGEYTQETYLSDGVSPADEELARAYFPPNTVGVSPTAIIDGEDRTVVNPTNVGPYCNTCYMYAIYDDNSTGIFSGFIIGPFAAVTAEHCVYDSVTKKRAVSVKVVPAKSEDFQPYGEAWSVNIVHSEEYIKTQRREDDYAIIELNNNIGNKCGWLGLHLQDNYNEADVQNTGYPGYPDAPMQNSTTSLMILGAGKIKNTYSGSSQYSGMMTGDWDASAGNSGGPVFALHSTKGHCAIGILTAGSASNGSYGSSYTTATRISQKMFDLFLSYRR